MNLSFDLLISVYVFVFSEFTWKKIRDPQFQEIDKHVPMDM